jgi:hypothetical protein
VRRLLPVTAANVVLVAEMFAVPGVIPVARPEFTVATEVVSLFHVTLSVSRTSSRFVLETLALLPPPA